MIGTGSELDIAFEAGKALAAAGIGVRVVSLPSWELFAAQDESYRAQVLPPGLPKIAIEAGTTFGWERWVGNDGDKGAVLGIEHFGASAPYQRLYEEFGLTVENLIARANAMLGR